MGESWDKGVGRPKELDLREALIVTCGYMRNNISQEIWVEIFGVSQSCISRYIAFLTPIIEHSTEEFRPTSRISMSVMEASPVVPGRGLGRGGSLRRREASAHRYRVPVGSSVLHGRA